MIWSQRDQQQVNDNLRTLLEGGMSTSEAIRHLHVEQGIGKLWLVKALQAVTQCGFKDAARVVVRAAPHWFDDPFRQG